MKTFCIYCGGTNEVADASTKTTCQTCNRSYKFNAGNFSYNVPSMTDNQVNPNGVGQYPNPSKLKSANIPSVDKG